MMRNWQPSSSRHNRYSDFIKEHSMPRKEDEMNPWRTAKRDACNKCMEILESYLRQGSW